MLYESLNTCKKGLLNCLSMKMEPISLLSSEIHPKHQKQRLSRFNAKTVLQISKILQIMTLSELSIHVFGENWLCSSALISYESDYF